MNPSIDLKDMLFEKLKLLPGEAGGKNVIVTGAGRGIGLQTARAFALLGARVVIAELSTESGAAAEAQIRGEGGQARFLGCDVSKRKSVEQMAERVHADYGAVDVLINNAIRCPAVAVVDMDPDLFDQVIAVNLRGTFLTCRTFVPEMIARQQGVILNLVSTDAMPGLAAYIASKQGITGFSQSLALEVGAAGVKVIPFGPGMVDTPGIRGVVDDLAPRLGLTREQFLGLSLHAAYDGLMPAEHAGAAAAYLALRLANEFHGQVINGYEVLERAGFLKAAVVQDPAAAAAPAGGMQPVEIKGLIGQIAQIVKETGMEFEKLPVFVRPMARSGFKGKAGMSLEDWQRGLQGLIENVTRLSASERQGWAGRLDKLIVYYRGVPAETGRFTRDTQMLRQVAELCAARIRLIEQLKDGLGEDFSD